MRSHAIGRREWSEISSDPEIGRALRGRGSGAAGDLKLVGARVDLVPPEEPEGSLYLLNRADDQERAPLAVMRAEGRLLVLARVNPRLWQAGSA